MKQITNSMKSAILVYIVCISSGIVISHALYGIHSTLTGATAGVFVATMWCGLTEYLTM